MDNKHIYTINEFDSWVYREGLIDAETFLIDNYLDKTKKTLEAGTAGGRILFSMLEKGFSDLSGYDFVPEFIDQAKKRDSKNLINFSVEDAIALNYNDDSFEQIIYLQQIVCFLGSYDKAKKAIEEAYRILKKGGVALFSFCDYKYRTKHFLYFLLVQYLRLFRVISQSKFSTQHLPWFKLSGRPNWKLFLDKEPYNYWFNSYEAYKLLSKIGFSIKGIASQKQIDEKKLIVNYKLFERREHTDMLYFVCEK